MNKSENKIILCMFICFLLVLTKDISYLIITEIAQPNKIINVVKEEVYEPDFCVPGELLSEKEIMIMKDLQGEKAVKEYFAKKFIEEEPPANNTCMAYSKANKNFEIKTKFSNIYTYYFIKIAEASTGEVKQTIFIHAGQTANVHVPDGTYYIRWVTGDKWYGYEEYFNTTSAQQASEDFTFEDTTGWDLELYPVKNGNLFEKSIDFEDF